MYLGTHTLSFTKHVLFQASTVKSGPFNEVRSLGAPQVTTIYGALEDCAVKMKCDLSILDKITIAKIESLSVPSVPLTNMLIWSAPLSPFDVQPKGIDYDDNYTTLKRIYPRKIYPLIRPKYRIKILAEDDEAKDFTNQSFRLLASHTNGVVGFDSGMGYKKKLLGSFDCTSKWSAINTMQLEQKTIRICEVLSDCPSKFGSVIPLQPIMGVLHYFNRHRPSRIPEQNHVSVYSCGSTVLVKMNEVDIRWYKKETREDLDVFGVSDLIEYRYVSDQGVKAVQGVFTTHAEADN